MKRQLTRLAVAVLTASVIAGPSAAARRPQGAGEGRWSGRCSGWQMGENLTLARYLADPARGSRQLHRLASCVFEWKASGYGVPTSTIERESGWWPWAKNPDTASACIVWHVDYVPYGYCGLGQHAARYWPGRVLAFIEPEWFRAWPQISPLDPRANLIAMAAMIRNQGGVCPAWCYTKGERHAEGDPLQRLHRAT